MDLDFWDCFGRKKIIILLPKKYGTCRGWQGRVAQSVVCLTQDPGVPGSIPGPDTYFHFSFRLFKKGSCQLLVEVCARSTG